MEQTFGPMSQRIWETLCPGTVPAKFASIVARTRAELDTAWAAVPDESRAALVAQATTDRDPIRLLRALQTTANPLYQVAVKVRGLSTFVPLRAGAAGAAGAAAAGSAAAAGVAAPATQKTLPGLEFQYESAEWLVPEGPEKKQ